MQKFKYAILVSLVLLVVACQQPGTGVDSTGSEYMPDMGHSIAYEANVYNYYFLNTWDSASVVQLKPMSMPRKPVDGTIPRGWAGSASDMAGNLTSAPDEGISIPLSGHVPYYYENTEEERTRATAELIDNPFPITEEGLARAEDLYNIYCGICHGEKGDGAGYLVRDADPATGDAGGKYPVQPANFLTEEFLAASNGRYYHAIMHGKNVMGAYADKLSYEERWQVIHYIRALQADETGTEYSADANTLNPSFGMPMADMPVMAMEAGHDDEHHDGEHHDDHNHDHGMDHGDHHSDDHGDHH